MSFVGLYGVIIGHDPKTIREVMNAFGWSSESETAKWVAEQTGVDLSKFKKLLNGNDQVLTKAEREQIVRVLQTLMPLGR